MKHILSVKQTIILTIVIQTSPSCLPKFLNVLAISFLEQELFSHISSTNVLNGEFCYIPL